MFTFAPEFLQWLMRDDTWEKRCEKDENHPLLQMKPMLPAFREGVAVVAGWHMRDRRQSRAARVYDK